MTEREQALHVLIDVLEQEHFLKDALEEAVRQDEISLHGHGYLWKITKGVTERALEMDATINGFSKQKIKRMHPLVRNILRLGSYELLYMDSIPVSATVNECIRLTKRVHQHKASGFVNAVLRKISREGQPKEMIESWDLSIRYSMPEWITKKWLARFGVIETEKMLQAFLQERPLSIRIRTGNISKTSLVNRLLENGVESRPVEGIEDALLVWTHGSLTELSEFSKGLFFVQDTASMSVCHFAEIHDKERVLDICASPGGKTFHAADLVGKDGFVDARDISKFKLKRLEENKNRGGYSNVSTKVWDARVFDEDAVGKYDVVLADVPCSGLGVLGRKPEIKYRLKETDIDQLRELAQSILENARMYIKEQGRLVFSTCTISEEENEKQVQAFIQRHPDFSIIREKQFLPGEMQAGNDGFYICVMKKNG